MKMSDSELYAEMYRLFGDYLHELQAHEIDAEERRLMNAMRNAAVDVRRH